jgi:hypothetical protein
MNFIDRILGTSYNTAKEAILRELEKLQAPFMQAKPTNVNFTLMFEFNKDDTISTKIIQNNPHLPLDEKLAEQVAKALVYLKKEANNVLLKILEPRVGKEYLDLIKAKIKNTRVKGDEKPLIDATQVFGAFMGDEE